MRFFGSNITSMRQVIPFEYTDAFSSVITKTHRMISFVEVLYNGQVLGNAPISSGTIRWGSDQSTAVLDCVINEPNRTPGALNDYLMPDGHELRVWRGIVLPSPNPLTWGDDELTWGDLLMSWGVSSTGTGTVVAAALGTFPVQRSRISARDRASRVTAHDRSQFVKDAGFEDTYWIDAKTYVDDALETLIGDAYLPAQFNFPSTNVETPLLAWDQGDRWEEARELARTAGWVLYLDGEGVFSARQQADINSTPVASLESGVNLIDASVSLDRGPAFNKVIARSRNSSTGVEYEGVATLFGGRFGYDTTFGHKPKVIYSDKIGSQEAADSMAQRELAQVGSIAVSTDFSALPDVRLEIEDVVYGYVPQLGVNRNHIIDTLTIGLGPEVAMTGTTRVVLA